MASVSVTFHALIRLRARCAKRLYSIIFFSMASGLRLEFLALEVALRRVESVDDLAIVHVSRLQTALAGMSADADAGDDAALHLAQRRAFLVRKSFIILVFFLHCGLHAASP